MFPLLQCLLKWSYLKGSGTLVSIAEGIKKHTLEGWVGLLIAKLLERNKVKRLSLFGSFLAFEKRTPPNEGGGEGTFKQPLYFSLLQLLPHLALYLDAGL